MSFKHLRTLVAIADHRTFSEAADAVFLTHAAVSQQMRALEEALQITIFDRSTRTPSLNPTGLALVDKARELLWDYDNLVPSILSEKNFVGDFVLGTVPTVLTGFVPRSIVKLKLTCPELRLGIRPSLTSALVTALQRHELDAAIITKPASLPGKINFLPIAQEPLHLIAAKEEPLADPRELLKKRPFIRFTREAVVGNLIEAWMQDQGIRVNEVMELDSLDTINSMVFANLGVSIVPKLAVAPFNPLPLRHFSLGGNAPTRMLAIAYHQETTRLHIIEEIAKCMLGVIKANSLPEHRA